MCNLRVSRVRVYPRACGGTWIRSLVRVWVAGLSPRLRGNHARLVAVESLKRSIPALAGEPNPGHRIPHIARVYPRACGGTASGGTLAL